VYESDPEMIVWWATEIECASALARGERSGSVAPVVVDEAFRRLNSLAESWHVVEPVDAIRRIARRVVRVHDLRAADALQLAAALHAAQDQPGSLEVVSLDTRLVEAAKREGFPVTGRT